MFMVTAGLPSLVAQNWFEETAGSYLFYSLFNNSSKVGDGREMLENPLKNKDSIANLNIVSTFKTRHQGLIIGR